MSARVMCQNCGGRVELPAGYAKAKIRCSHCGYYAEVPPNARAADDSPPSSPRSATPVRAAVPVPAKPVVRAKRSVDPRDHRPQFESDSPAGPPLLQGNSDFDDDAPYTVPGTGTRMCPHCRGTLPLDATLCVHCGRDIATGEKTTREFQSLNRTWFEGWPPEFRAKLFAGAVLLDIMLIGLFVGVDSLLGIGFFTLAVQVGLQAYNLGTFDAIIVKRTTKGQATLTRIRRVAFIKFAPEKLAWKGSHSVGVIASHNPGVFAWMVCAYLFTLLVVPGVLFYWFVIRPERCEVSICDVYGSTDGIVFRSTDHAQAREVATTIADATGLSFRSVM